MRTGPHLLLPESLQPVVDAIGYRPTIALVRVHAGETLYVPKPWQVWASHPIADIIGEAAMARLTAAMGGKRLDVPACDALLIEQRDQAILRRANNGENATELAKAYSLTERSVYRVLKRTRAKEKM